PARAAQPRRAGPARALRGGDPARPARARRRDRARGIVSRVGREQLRDGHRIVRRWRYGAGMSGSILAHLVTSVAHTGAPRDRHKHRRLDHDYVSSTGWIVLLSEGAPPSRQRVVALRVPQRGVLTSAAPTGYHGGPPPCRDRGTVGVAQ